MKPRVMTIYGTRPEAIKVAPVIKASAASDLLDGVTVVTGQHREMLDQVNELFAIVPDHDLSILKHGQTLAGITSRVLDGLDPILAAARPDAVVVQGDTTTSTAAALAAFYRQIPVVHLEADIVITRNTVIDALLLTAGGARIPFCDPALEALAGSGRPILLVTSHRRENWGDAMHQVGGALARIARSEPDLVIVLPAHCNPMVREALLPHLDGLANVVVTEPLPYGEFIRMLALARIVLTDSGGVQEEAPSLGTPVLVMRENTERPEAVSAGTVLLIGTGEDRIVKEVERLLHDPAHYAAMANAVNPYGDGSAAQRVVAAVADLLGVGARIGDFRL